MQTEFIIRDHTSCAIHNGLCLIRYSSDVHYTLAYIHRYSEEDCRLIFSRINEDGSLGTAQTRLVSYMDHFTYPLPDGYKFETRIQIFRI